MVIFNESVIYEYFLSVNVPDRVWKTGHSRNG